jgi:hypothetical protein
MNNFKLFYHFLRWVVFICMPGRLYTLTGAVNASAASQTVWTNVVSEAQPVLQPLFIFTGRLFFCHTSPKLKVVVLLNQTV